MVRASPGRLIIPLLLCLTLPSLHAEGPNAPPDLHAQAVALRMKLSVQEEAAQVLLVGIGGEGSPSESALGLLGGTPLGGVVLFGFNIPDRAFGLGQFTAAVQEAASHNGSGLPFIVALDEEGGVVFRFHGSDVTRLPPPLEAARRGPAFVRLLGESAGRELQALGVNLALAPVVELQTEQNLRFLGNRTYGNDPALVDACAAAFIEGLQSQGVAATAKHFPGNNASDPHKGLPRLEIDRASYERLYLPRFAAATREGVAVVMLSHVVVPALDPQEPASLSRRMVQGELKQGLGFPGVALTDDLFMKALTLERAPERSAVEALGAGADLLMITSQDAALRIRDAIVRAVENGILQRSRLDDAVERIIELKLRFSMQDALDPALRSRRLAAFARIVAEDQRAVADFGR